MQHRRGEQWTRLPEHLGLRVTRGPVPTELPGAERPWPWIQVTPCATLVDFDDGTRLLVRDGRDVTLQYDDDADPTGDPSWLLQGWAVTLAALQRGELSLHAATVRIGDTVLAVAGDRGAGKSTTAMGLRNRGHQLLVDDVALIEFRGNEAWITPYARNVHLLPDAAEALGIDFAALAPLALGRDKSAFRAEDPPIEPHRLDLIVVLDPIEPQDVAADGAAPESAAGVTVTQTRGADRLGALIDHTVRDGLAPLVLGQSAYFTQLARLSNAAPVHVVRRPREGGWTLDKVLDAIEALAEQTPAQPESVPPPTGAQTAPPAPTPAAATAPGTRDA